MSDKPDAVVDGAAIRPGSDKERGFPSIVLREPEPLGPQLRQDDGTNTREPPPGFPRNSFDGNPGQDLPTREDMNPDIESRAERDLPMDVPD